MLIVFVLTEAEANVWINKYGWKDLNNGDVSVANQEENIKTKNITEKIVFDSVAGIIANTHGSR